MAAQEVLNALNQIYDLGDSLDDAGIGTLALTNGNKTTREACRLDIAHFLVYVGNGGSFVTDAQASLLGIVLGSQYGQVTPEAFRNVAKDVGVPEADKSLSILTFCHCDQVLSRKNGTKSTSLTDVLVNLYESVGQLMVALNENVVSRSRYDSYIREMKSVIASHLEDGDDSSGIAPTGKEAGTHEDGKKTKPSGKKKSSTKKMNSDRGAGTKAAPRGKNMGRGQIPAGDVLIPGKYKGIHNVTGKPETISPFGSWTIDVPAGFSYTMDPECASRSMMGMGPSYSLQIQTTEDCDFSSAYDSSFGLAIYPSSVVWVNIEDGGEDLRSSYAQSTLRNLQNDGFRNYTVLVHTPDVLVQYDNSNRDSEAITINFQIICAGVNAGTNGQIDVQGPDMYKLEEKALEMLASVGSIHQEFNTDQYMPFAIPSKVSPIFKTPEVIEIAPAVKLPIPDGFHATNDQSQTNGRSFIIVPEAYPFSKDPMQASVGISGAVGQINLPDQYQYGTMLGMILSKLPDGVFTENSKMWFSRISDSYAAFFQENHDEDAPTWALYRILLFAGSQAFVLSMRINFGRVKLPFLATSIDARNIVRHWLYHIVAKDTSGKDIPVASHKVPDVFHEHLTLVSSGQYTTHRDADFVGQSIRMLMEKHDNTGDEAYGLMEIPKDSYKLDAEARRLATVFRMDENLFDPYRDTEAMIRLGMFQDVKMFHALRSLAWTVSCKADQEGRTLGSYGFEELKEIGEMINKSPLNYKTESWCSGLCSHYDWHVFYVPESYIESKCRGRTDLRLLCNKENRGGSSIHIISPLFNMMDRTNDIISRCEETLESLEALRKDLVDLLPVMQTIYDGFMQDRDRSQPLEGVLAEALTAWCALAIAAKEPFYSEEAADTPEADAGLDGPMERPSDDLDAAPVARKAGAASKPVAKKPSRPLPAGEVLDLGGTTVIEAGKFSGNMTLKNIIIPEGVSEIGERAFYSCLSLETVVLPKSLKKIGKMAFSSCHSLKQIEIPEGVEEIDNNAFDGTRNLKEVHLPDSLKKVDQFIFGVVGGSPYATAYMSGDLAIRLYENGRPSFMSPIIARRYVIDGKGYENMCDYWMPASSEPSGFGRGTPSLMDEDAREQRKAQYRPNMEAAVSEGKSLEEMIEAGRKATSYLRNEEAYENALKHLDSGAKVTVKDKHFVLTGFGDNEEEVIAEIEKCGGEVHGKMVKKADYLVVCLTGDPGASKLNKALEWREKGATNLIVSDYQMWQAILGGKKSTSKSSKNAQATTDGVKTTKAAASKKTEAPKKTPASKAPAANRELETITAPEGTTVIEKKAYKGRKAMERVVIPEGVTEIQEEAFRDCSGLREVVFPNSLTTIGANAFYRCKKLESIVLPDSVTQVGEGAFNGCEGMKSAVVSKGMTKLAKSLFYNCKKLETVEIPDSVTEIGAEAFHNCEKLEQVSIPDSVKKIGANAFFCTGLTEIELPEGAQLEHDVFYGCKKLTEVSIPEGTTAIPKNLFKSCENLEKVSIPDTVTAIGDSAFYDCHRLAEIDLPEGVTEIEEYAFSGCGFSRITIPDGVQRITRNAFSSCTRLEHISIPEGVDSIGDWAFSYCENLKSVQLPKALRSIGERAFSYCAKLARIDLPKGLETIGDNAFYECAEITQVIIPDGVTKIGESAFQKCSALTSVTLPESLVSIGSYAFLDCKQLTSIRIPASVKEIGFWVGSHTTTDIIVEGRRDYVERYRLQRAFSSLIQWADEPGEPSRGNILDHETGDVLDLHGARIVEESRFENDENNEIQEQIESGILVLPEGLTEIRHNAFNHCSMNAVVFPKSMRTIGDHSFEDCLFLQLIELQEGLEIIESRAFSGNNKLTDVYLPDSLKTLWKDAFQDGFVKTGKHVTIHMSGAMAAHLRYETYGEVDDRLTAVKAFVIDGVTYDRLEDYRAKLAQEARAKQDQARREREEAERQAAEERKKAERERINAQIYDLSQEMESLKGLFAGMKRKKLQKQIDDLNEQLRRLQ